MLFRSLGIGLIALGAKVGIDCDHELLKCKNFKKFIEINPILKNFFVKNYKHKSIYVPFKKRLSYKEKREFEQLAKEIEQLQNEKQEIESRLSDTGISYQQLNELSERIGVVNQLIETKEWRWVELSEYES